MCTRHVTRALRDDHNGKIVCFNCVTNYSPEVTDSDDEMQAALSAAIKGRSHIKTCIHPSCGNTFVSSDARTNFCPSCRRKLRVCEVTSCGTLFVPLNNNDHRCPEHAPRCVSCGRKSDQNLCSTCTSSIEKGICTSCGEKYIDGVYDYRGRCMNCMDEELDFFMGEGYCRCGTRETDNPGEICKDCPTYRKLCPGCWDQMIKSDETLCKNCKETKYVQ